MKTYRVLLLTALLLCSKGIAAIALEPVPTGQPSASGMQTQLVVPNSCKLFRVGVPGRREGAGTR
ncbi:MAG: hypothetical protein KME27_05615 [Lyngbya sp. HA4199-MV5]|nr:hypothetical protein [Lyngbya sp. HA4199-MV5]